MPKCNSSPTFQDDRILVNGAFGTVLAFERNLQGEIFAIIVQFDQESVGKEQRLSKRHLSEKYKLQTSSD